jgi:hypothetical protein
MSFFDVQAVFTPPAHATPVEHAIHGVLPVFDQVEPVMQKAGQASSLW